MVEDDEIIIEIPDEGYEDSDMIPEGESYTGIVAGLPIIVVEDPEVGVWIAPGNWFAGLVLGPYMESWFYNEETPIFVYEGTYWDGLFQWLFMGKYEEDI
jgi:hypothetical protein